MNKKGLTFMSFAISVICLGVVLIIMWPRINKIIEDSYENIFSNKVKDMIASVGKTYLNDQSYRYSNVISGSALLKNVNEKYQYILNLNSSGKVVSFKITNGKYKTEGFSENGVKVDEVGSTYKIVHTEKKFTLNSNGEFLEQ